MSETEPCIRLFSDGLLSRHGHNDGDAPDEWLDYCDERGVMQPPSWRYEILPAIVRKFLLPPLDQKVEVVIIACNHNSVRALTVDGVNVEDEWHGPRDPAMRLTPEAVSVPLATIFGMISEMPPEEAAS